MKKILLLICFCTAILCAQAQRHELSYAGTVNFGYSAKGFGDTHTFSLETTHGIKIGRSIFAGVQTGVSFNTLTLSDDADDTPGSFVEIPLLADFKYFFLPDAKVKPYAEVAAGATLATEAAPKSYFTGNLGIGISIRRFELGAYYQRFGNGVYGGFHNGFMCKLGLNF